MTREELEAVVVTSPHAKGRLKQQQRLNGLEDYLHVGGDRMSINQAARRLGRSPRTICRWRKALRQVTP